jgi:hypothetical protein
MMPTRPSKVFQWSIIGAPLLVLVLILWLSSMGRKPVTSLAPPPSPEATNQIGQPPRPNTPRRIQTLSSADEALFVRYVLPVATDFARRVELSGIKMPFDGPISLNRLTMFKAGKRIHIFVVDGHSVFQYHDIQRGGQNHRGIHSFNRAGKDEYGTPWNVDPLLAYPGRYADAIARLSDPVAHPLIDLGATGSTARGLVSNLRPGVTYDPGRSWQDAAGTVKLPFYNYIYERPGQNKDNPANVFTDSVNVILKSTASGLVLQHYEDLGIAFLK